MAEELHIPEDMIDEWKQRGIIKSCTPKWIETFTLMLKEAYYCRTHHLTAKDIPDDPFQPLWDDKSKWDEIP